jgi:hypothetical protein
MTARAMMTRETMELLVALGAARRIDENTVEAPDADVLLALLKTGFVTVGREKLEDGTYQMGFELTSAGRATLQASRYQQ